MASIKRRRLPHKLLEETKVLNAIYGKETMELTSSNSRNIICNLHFSGEAIAYVITFPVSYPRKPPRLKSLEPAWMQNLTQGKARLAALDKALGDVFVPGAVCMFDAIESIRDLLIPTDEPDQDVDATAGMPAAPVGVDIEVLQSKRECAACLDELIVPDLAKLDCKHYLCTECMNCEFAAC